jgi:hypothetical protein
VKEYSKAPPERNTGVQFETTVEAAERYHADGFCPIDIPLNGPIEKNRGKKPRGLRWEKRRFTREEISEAFVGLNCGIINGPSGLVMFDPTPQRPKG